MLQHTLPVLFARKVRIVRQSVLYGAFYYKFWLYITVGFGHNTAIDVAWLVCRRSAMVFHCLCHCVNLLRVEPLHQTLVATHHTSRRRVMHLTALAEAYIVIGGSTIDHINIYVVKLRQTKALVNHTHGMVALMCGIKSIVEWQNVLLYKLT